MDNLESLSNDELRSRLLQYGFPNLPVTQTTRKVLIKKLRNHVDTKQNSARRETISVAKYSSDDDSEIEVKTKTTVTNDRRATISVQMRPPSTGPEKNNKRRSGRITPSKPDLLLSSQAPTIEDIAEDTDEEINDLLQNPRRSKSTSPSRVRAVAKKAKTPPVEIIELDDEEEEEEEGEYISPVKSVTTPSRSTRTTITHNYNTSTTTKANDYASPTVSEILARKRYTIGDGAISSPSSSNAYSRPTISTSYNRYDSSASGLSSGLSQRYAGIQNYSTASTAYAREPEEENDEEDEINFESTAPYLSDFTRRLSTLRAEPLAAGRTTQTQAIYRSSSGTSSRNPISTGTKKTSSSVVDSAKVFLGALDRKYKIKRSLIAFLTILLLIFIVVFFFF